MVNLINDLAKIDLGNRLLIGLTVVILVFTVIQIALLRRTDTLIKILSPVLSADAKLHVLYDNTKAGLPIALRTYENKVTLPITIRNFGTQIAQNIMFELEFDGGVFTNFSTEFDLSESKVSGGTFVRVLVPRILHPKQKMDIQLQFNVEALHHTHVINIKGSLFWSDFQPRQISCDATFTLVGRLDENS